LSIFQHNTCPICRHSIGGDTVDDVASIRPPALQDTSDDDDTSPADQPITTRSAIASNSYGSRLLAGFAEQTDSDDAANMEVDCTNTDSLNGWINVSDCAHSRAMNDSSQVTSSSGTASPLQAINFESWSDDYDSDD